MPGWDIPLKASKTFRRKFGGTYGRGAPVDVSQVRSVEHTERETDRRIKVPGEFRREVRHGS